MTVEAAVAIGTLVLVTSAAIAAVATVMASIRCVDAARELARLAARGESGRGLSAATGIAPGGARMDLRTEGDTVVVVVAAAPVGLLPIEVSGTAAAVVEPGAAPEPGAPPDSRPAPDPAAGSDLPGGAAPTAGTSG